MTNDVEKAIAPDMKLFVVERQRIWQELEDASKLAVKLTTLANQITSDSSTQLLDPQTKENIPPTELRAVIPRIEQELAESRKLEKQITQCQADIEQIKRNDRYVIATIIIGSCILLFVLLFVLHIL